MMAVLLYGQKGRQPADAWKVGPVAGQLAMGTALSLLLGLGSCH